MNEPNRAPVKKKRKTGGKVNQIKVKNIEKEISQDKLLEEEEKRKKEIMERVRKLKTLEYKRLIKLQKQIELPIKLESQRIQKECKSLWSCKLNRERHALVPEQEKVVEEVEEKNDISSPITPPSFCSTTTRNSPISESGRRTPETDGGRISSGSDSDSSLNHKPLISVKPLPPPTRTSRAGRITRRSSARIQKLSTISKNNTKVLIPKTAVITSRKSTFTATKKRTSSRIRSAVSSPSSIVPPTY
jgi:hypothetical protein